MDDAVPGGLSARARPRFIHSDVVSAYSPWCSPSTPDDYVRALKRHYSQSPDDDNRVRPALAIADYGLHSVVKTAVACDRAGIEQIVALRVRVVPQRTFRELVASCQVQPQDLGCCVGSARCVTPAD